MRQILLTASDAFKLRIVAPVVMKRDISKLTATSLTICTPGSATSSPEFILEILTPKFFTILSTQRSLVSFLQDTCLDLHKENRTALISIARDEKLGEAVAATRLLCLLERAINVSEGKASRERHYASHDKSKDRLDILTASMFSLLTLLTPFRSMPQGVYPAPALPSTRCSKKDELRPDRIPIEVRNNSNGSNDGQGSKPFFLDSLVKEQYSAKEQRQYVKAVITTVVWEKVVGYIGGS